jgi:hypothetical protein
VRLVLIVALALVATDVWAQPAGPEAAPAPAAAPAPDAAPAVVPPRERSLDLSPIVGVTRLPQPGPLLHTFASVALGKGLRFNNPYRLATPLGEDAESLSTTAAYLDLAVGAALGPPDALQHGGEVALSIATDGVPQEVLALSYVALLPLGERFLARGRAGVPIVIEPDANLGFELAVGGAFLLTGGFGFTGELVGSLFYGAGTLDKTTTTIPVLSLELGVYFEYEVLP